jgi:hypothetical protein
VAFVVVYDVSVDLHLWMIRGVSVVTVPCSSERPGRWE